MDPKRKPVTPVGSPIPESLWAAHIESNDSIKKEKKKKKKTEVVEGVGAEVKVDMEGVKENMIKIHSIKFQRINLKVF